MSSSSDIGLAALLCCPGRDAAGRAAVRGLTPKPSRPLPQWLRAAMHQVVTPMHVTGRIPQRVLGFTSARGRAAELLPAELMQLLETSSGPWVTCQAAVRSLVGLVLLVQEAAG